MKNRFLLSFIFILAVATGCASASQPEVTGVISQVDLGKDGYQVMLQADDSLYNVTISELQTDMVGSFDQLFVGAEIEVSGKEIAGMDPPLIVADTVRILEGPNPLVGSAWVLSTFNDQKPINDYQPTLEFEAEQVSGTTGCNHYGGTYQISGDTIKFEGVFSTEMACMEPEGLMDQEQKFLETLRDVVRFSLTDEELILIADGDRHLKFLLSGSPVTGTPAGDNNETVSVDASTEVSDGQVSASTGPLWEYNRYLDAETGIGILIPESWIVTGIVEGEYAILQSYPEDKYVGGEPLEAGDTKCDLSIQPMGMSLEEVVNQMKSFPMTTILSVEPFTLSSGQVGSRLEIDSMGKTITFVAGLGERVVVLTCFGDFSEVDEIALTIFASE